MPDLAAAPGNNRVQPFSLRDAEREALVDALRPANEPPGCSGFIARQSTQNFGGSDWPAKKGNRPRVRTRGSFLRMTILPRHSQAHSARNARLNREESARKAMAKPIVGLNNGATTLCSPASDASNQKAKYPVKQTPGAAAKSGTICSFSAIACIETQIEEFFALRNQAR